VNTSVSVAALGFTIWGLIPSTEGARMEAPMASRPKRRRRWGRGE